jgi:hypothetical protein
LGVGALIAWTARAIRAGGFQIMLAAMAAS